MRPYLAVFALAMACSLLYAGARTSRAYLIQPLFDQIIVPQLRHEQPVDAADWKNEARGWLDRLRGEPAEQATPTAPEAALDAQRRSAIAAEVRAALPRMLLAAILIITLLPLSHLAEEYLSQWVLGRVLVDVQQQLCSKLLVLPLRFHDTNARGETLSRVTNDVQRAHQSLDVLLSDVIQSLLALIVGVGTLLWISWQLTLTLALAAPLVVGVIAAFGQRIRRNAERRQRTQGDVTQRLIQILSGIKVIKAFAAQRGEEQAFSRQNTRLFHRNLKVVKYRALSRGIVEGVTNLIGVVVMLGGVAIVLGQLWGLTLGELSAFVVVMQSATYRPVKDLTKGWTRIQEAIPSAQRFFDLLDADPETSDPPGALEIHGVERGIRISKVSFSYGREPVLRDVSLDVAAGEVIAIVGRTGSGKTTLADLLLRFYNPDAGAIEVDGLDLRRVSRASWLRQVAVVTQEPFLCSGTIAENIRYGRPAASDAEVLAAARAAHVDEFAERLLEGYDTDVGEAGVLLSGGQRQRITIARAILREPKVLIFDEATSSLDSKSERFVQEAIDSLLGGRTVFIIAHRLSTVRHADKILVLDEGRVLDLGSHDELMARGGLYRELMGMQAGTALPG